MGLHHATLKAAVLVYAALIGTMTEEALKATIAKDEKGFTAEEVDEIYAAVLKSKSETGTQTDTPQFEFKDGILVSGERPAWLDELLASNQAIQDSNQALIDAIAQFKESAGDLVQEVKTAATASAENKVEVAGNYELKVKLPEYDDDAVYEVVVPFRDSADFTKLYEAGDDVSHLGEHRIKHLLSTGNVEEA